MEDRNKHLEFIQNVIGRMAQHSFLLKGWSVTVIAGLFALSSENIDHRFVLVAVIALTAFWFLDGYYLQLERLFRAHYDRVRVGDSTDFSMHVKDLKKGENTLDKALMSTTQLVFYVPILILVFVITYLIG